MAPFSSHRSSVFVLALLVSDLAGLPISLRASARSSLTSSDIRARAIHMSFLVMIEISIHSENLHPSEIQVFV